MRFGFTKKRVLPVPEPPMMQTFLLRLNFGFGTRSSMFMYTSCARMMFCENVLLTNGLMSALVPQREEPCSSPGRLYWSLASL